MYNFIKGDISLLPSRLFGIVYLRCAQQYGRQWDQLPRCYSDEEVCRLVTGCRDLVCHTRKLHAYWPETDYEKCHQLAST